MIVEVVDPGVIVFDFVVWPVAVAVTIYPSAPVDVAQLT